MRAGALTCCSDNRSASITAWRSVAKAFSQADRARKLAARVIKRLRLPEDQVRAYARQFTVVDADTGEDRDGVPTDHFPVSGMENAPDLSLMAKARAGFSGPYGTGLSQLVNGMGGAEYIASILTGYTGESKEEAGSILYENTAFPGGWIAMSQPLWGDDVVFADGSPTDLQTEAQDVARFL